MRWIGILAGVATACGGGPGGADGAIDSAISDSAISDSAIDSGNNASMVTGTWIDRYHTETGLMMQPACVTAPRALVIDDATGLVTTYPGTCMSDGSFEIPVPAATTTYYLAIDTSLYETSARNGLDLSSDHQGRPMPALATGVTLAFNLTAMEPWATGDTIQGWSSNVGMSVSFYFGTAGLTTGATSLTNVAQWFGALVDSAQGDRLRIVQLGAHSGAPGMYSTLDRAYLVPPFTMVDNTVASIPATGSDAFNTPAAGSIPMSIDVAAYNAQVAATNPAATPLLFYARLYATVAAGAAAPPPLFDFLYSGSGLSSGAFGTVTYADPFPSGWERLVMIQMQTEIQYSVGSGTAFVPAQLYEIVPRSAADAGTLAPLIAPPTAPTIDGASAFSAHTISVTPRVAWAAPAIGTPTDYAVQVWELTPSISSTVLTITTKQTSVRIPQGYLLSGHQYAFSVRATLRGADEAITPLRVVAPSASADAVSALMTVP